jgi:ribosomal protein S18 acetylase RimI-like enzyme
VAVRLVDAAPLAADARFLDATHRLFADLVAGGAALGWVDPPGRPEIAALLASLTDPREACAVAALDGDEAVAFGYWRRYARPTHRPHADLEKMAVAPAAQGRGTGRRLLAALIRGARAAGIEVLTLDARGDNARAHALYRRVGFAEYGRLRDFVAVGERRYDKVFYALDLRCC